MDMAYKLLFFFKKMSVSWHRFFDAFCEYLVYSGRRVCGGEIEGFRSGE